MALSHQWFVQWSPPSMVITDIHSQYNNVNKWNNDEPKWSRDTLQNSGDKNNNHGTSDFNSRLDYNDDGFAKQDKSNTPDKLRTLANPSSQFQSRFYLLYLFAHGVAKLSYRVKFTVKDYVSSISYALTKMFPILRQCNKYDKGIQVYLLESPSAAGFALWLTMLGLARPQSVPADMDTPPFNTLYKWKQIDFEYSSWRQRKVAVMSGKFVPGNVLPLGLEVWGSRVFVTIPRWKKGVPATLATVSRYGGMTSPPLRPYPDWSFNSVSSNSKNCSGLISVFRVNIDPCGRLWVLDSGQTNSVDVPNQICPPSIVVFDLQTNELLARYVIPKKYVLQDSLYANIVIDARTEDCSDTHAYMADTWRFGLLVFRERDQKFWRFSHPFFFPDPLASNFTLHGLNFQWTDGIFGLALSPTGQFQERILFFHPMSSYREFYVSTTILQDPSRISNSSTEFKLMGNSRGSSMQSSASAIDNRGVMFYGLVTRDSVGCWDTSKPYMRNTNGLVARNSDTLVFPNDIKIDQEVDQSVWVITNRLPMYQKAPLSPDEYNYRILYADTEEAVRGTICDPQSGALPSSMLNHAFNNKY